MNGQLPGKTALGLHEQGHVDRLVRDPHRGIVGEVELEPSGDLLRRPSLGEPPLDDGAQLRVPRQLRRPRSPGSCLGHPVGPHRPVAGRSAVAAHLARDRGRRPAELGRDGCQRRALGQAAGDLLAFASDRRSGDRGRVGRRRSPPDSWSHKCPADRDTPAAAAASLSVAPDARAFQNRLRTSANFGRRPTRPPLLFGRSGSPIVAFIA